MRIRWIFPSRRVIAAGLALLILIAVALPVYAQGAGRDRGQVVVGHDLTVRTGQTVRGNVVVLGGNVTVESGGRVTGDVTAFGGNVSVAGEVDGTVAALGGNVELADTAIVRHDVVVTGGSVQRASGAQVQGNPVEGPGFGRFFGPLTQSTLPFAPLGAGDRPMIPNWIGGMFRTAFGTVGMMILAALVVLLLPRPTRRVARTIADAPVASVGIGFLTLLAAAFLLPILTIISAVLVIVCIGLFGLVLLAMATIALGAAVIYGWIAAGLLVGERILALLHIEENLGLLAALVGVLIIGLLGAVPCLGFLFGLFVACLGLGAVILSRAGTRAYPNPILPPPPMPPVPYNA